jgi:hypothetical protein
MLIRETIQLVLVYVLVILGNRASGLSPPDVVSYASRHWL